MPFSEDDLLPISALQHLLFCPRQCALIHVEQLWAENRFTVEGRHLHEKADQGGRERRSGEAGKTRVGKDRAGKRGTGKEVTRSLHLRSLRLGLYGRADVVEFHPGAPNAAGHGVPFPVEYKRGKPKKNGSDLVQLCAQALCLEEMLETTVPGGVPAGAIFYGRTRRRLEVPFDPPLRRLTLETIDQLHEMIASRRTPLAVREKKCDRCSLLNLCMPEALAPSRSASGYLRRSLAVVLGADGPVSSAGDEAIVGT